MKEDQQELLAPYMDRHCVVCASEDLPGHNKINWMYSRGKRTHTAKGPLTMFLVVKIKKRFYLVTRHRIRKEYIMTSLTCAVMNFAIAWEKKMIYKDENLYKEFMDQVILEHI